jgi:hypothetical protein
MPFTVEAARNVIVMLLQQLEPPVLHRLLGAAGQRLGSGGAFAIGAGRLGLTSAAAGCWPSRYIRAKMKF